MQSIHIEHFNSFSYTDRFIPVGNTFTITPKPNTTRNFKRAMKRLRKLATVKPYDRIQKEMMVTRTAIDLDRIEKMLFQHMDSIWHVHHRKCRMIVMGWEQMDQLKMAMAPYSFTFPQDYRSSTVYDGQRVDFRGVEVVCVPWIDGIFAIPK